jgi:hypothetical protein
VEYTSFEQARIYCHLKHFFSSIKRTNPKKKKKKTAPNFRKEGSLGELVLVVGLVGSSNPGIQM